MVRYRECQRNHAAHLGSRVVDGCGEFMPADDESLRCAACDCHRNFHRLESDTITTTTPTPPQPLLTHRAPVSTAGNCYISFNTPRQEKTVPPVMMAFGGGGAAAESSSEALNGYRAGEMEAYAGTKKRFRTKFTEEQKEAMAEVAEEIGWRMQKQSEGRIVNLCNEIGIKRQVFKVWMHNNKQTLKRKLQP